MLFRVWYTYESLTRADIRNPDSKALNYYHQLIRFIPSVFLLSNNFRKNNNAEVFFLAPNEKNRLLFKIVFSGEKLRYLSPDWLSSGALLVKAFKKYKKNEENMHKKDIMFVNPGVHVHLFNEDKIDEFQFSNPIFVEGDKLELDKFNTFLNLDLTNKITITFDFISKNINPLFFTNYKQIAVESFSQTITIINFRIDNYSTNEGKESGPRHDK